MGGALANATRGTTAAILWSAVEPGARVHAAPALLTVWMHWAGLARNIGARENAILEAPLQCGHVLGIRGVPRVDELLRQARI